MPVERRDFLGIGFKFPFQFTSRTGGVFQGNVVAYTDDVVHIEESLQQILGTVVGQRVIRRDFGSRMRSIVFDPNDPTLDVQLDYIIRTAIETWEPRVVVGPILVDHSFWQDGRLEIDVEFRIIKTNVVGNLVFPYFLSEADRKTYTAPAKD